ncbi:hypothetical protein, partial [Sphingobacterium sp. UBA7249]
MLFSRSSFHGSPEFGYSSTLLNSTATELAMLTDRPLMATSWIDFENVACYYFSDGKSKSTL